MKLQGATVEVGTEAEEVEVEGEEGEMSWPPRTPALLSSWPMEDLR